MANQQLPEEVFVELDRRDEQQIVEELTTGAVLEELVYDVQGRQVLSYAGILFASARMGGIKVHEPKITETDNSWVVYCAAEDTSTGTVRYGGAEQPKTLPSGKPDPFAFAKAISKAERNAIRKVIPVPVINAVIKEWRQRTGGRRNVNRVRVEPNDPVAELCKTHGVSYRAFQAFSNRFFNGNIDKDKLELWVKLIAKLKPLGIAQPSSVEELCKKAFGPETQVRDVSPEDLEYLLTKDGQWFAEVMAEGNSDVSDS